MAVVAYHMKRDQSGPGICRASERTCPNGAFGHWDTPEQVWSAYEVAVEEGEVAGATKFATFSQRIKADPALRSRVHRKARQEVVENRRIALSLIRDNPEDHTGYEAMPQEEQAQFEKWATKGNFEARRVALSRLEDPYALSQAILEQEDPQVFYDLGKNPFLTNGHMAEVKARLEDLCKDPEEVARIRDLIITDRTRRKTLEKAEQEARPHGYYHDPEELEKVRKASAPSANLDEEDPSVPATTSSEQVPSSTSEGSFGQRTPQEVEEAVTLLKEAQVRWKKDMDLANYHLLKKTGVSAKGVTVAPLAGSDGAWARVTLQDLHLPTPEAQQVFREKFLKAFDEGGVAYSVREEAGGTTVVFFSHDELNSYTRDIVTAD